MVRVTVGLLALVFTLTLTACLPGSPVGHLDEAVLAGDILHVGGWAYDADAGRAPLEVGVSLDGTVVGHVTTGGARPDVEAVAGAGAAASGFTADLQVAATTGVHLVCAWPTNVGAGEDSLLGCRHVGVQNPGYYVPTPCCYQSGLISSAVLVDGGIHVRGFFKGGDRLQISPATWGGTPYLLDGGLARWDPGTGAFELPRLPMSRLLDGGISQTDGVGFDTVIPTARRPLSVCLARPEFTSAPVRSVPTISCQPVDG